MRKSIMGSSLGHALLSSPGGWLDLEKLATVELSSEDALYPFENALHGGEGDGWKAGSPGPQVIRLNFDRPQPISRIHVQFCEDHLERSQEFAIFASSPAQDRREVARQQWTFSPGGSTVETEDYRVNLPAVSTLELHIDPGRHDRQIFATIRSIAVA